MPSYYCTCPCQEETSLVVKNSPWRTSVLAVGGCAVSALALHASVPMHTLYASGTVSRGLQPVVTYAPTSKNFGFFINQPQEVPIAQPVLYSAPQALQHTLRLATVASGMLMLFAATLTLVQHFFRGDKFVALASMTGEALEEGPMRNHVSDVDAKTETLLGDKSFAISRRGMAPVFGVMLSPSLGIRPAMAGDAPAGPAGSVVISDPKGWIADNLPGSLSSKEFVRLTADILVRQGIEPENTVACVGVCRDELCQPLVDEIEGEWGDAFNMTSLAGMLTLGKTGLKAAMAHSPVDKDGRERYFFLAFPHIAVDTAGVGKCTRPGRNKTSSACGALVAFTNELKGGKPSMEYDPLDPEYSYMKTALMGLIPTGTAPDLLEVTKTAAEASLSQIEDLIAATVDPSKADYAVCTGVLVHQQDLRGRDAKVVGPSRQYVDQVWPTAFYVVKNGRKKDLIWRLERD